MRSKFLESELELYVQRLLVHESYKTGYRYRMLKISPSEERLKGYDAKITGISPFYCQFKTSDFLRQGPLFERRKAFLKLKGWPCVPFYSFALRVPNDSGDKKNSAMWQHNILHKQWSVNSSAVAYVAPAFHTRSELELHEPSIERNHCCLMQNHTSDSSISIQTVNVNGNDQCRIPFFDGLISIPPHVPVKKLSHHYCFTNHRDVTFHSDAEMPEGSKPFGAALRDFLISTVKRGDAAWTQKISIEAIRNMLGEMGENNDFLNYFISFGLFQAGIAIQEMGSDASEYFGHMDFIQQQIAFSASLNAYFGISTIALLKFEDN